MATLKTKNSNAEKENKKCGKKFYEAFSYNIFLKRQKRRKPL